MQNYHEEYIDGIRTITSKIKLDCEDLLNVFMDESHFDLTIDEDCDFYFPLPATLGGSVNGDNNLGFRFRKNFFNKEEIAGAYEGLNKAAVHTNNRGTSTGEVGLKKGGNRDWVFPWQVEVLDLIERGSVDGSTPESIMAKFVAKYGSLDYLPLKRGHLWHRSRVMESGVESYDNFFLNQLESGTLTRDRVPFMRSLITLTAYTSSIMSGIAGYYDRYPRLPYGRATNFTTTYAESFEKCYPFQRKLNSLFEELVPEKYAFQKSKAEACDPRFVIAGDTSFTTITVNKNYRTSAHRDGANLVGGFSNLSTVSGSETEGWEGGMLVLPEFRVAINLRSGDALLVDNAGIIHGNTEITPPAGVDLEDIERISMVSYFRGGMIELKSKEYEDARLEFVNTRQQDVDHSEHVGRKAWNGVSPGMWATKEWFDFLQSKGMTDEDGFVAEETFKEKETKTLDSFFS